MKIEGNPLTIAKIETCSLPFSRERLGMGLLYTQFDLLNSNSVN